MSRCAENRRVMGPRTAALEGRAMGLESAPVCLEVAGVIIASMSSERDLERAAACREVD